MALVVAVLATACGGGGGNNTTGKTAPPTITTVASELVPYCDAMQGMWILLYGGKKTAVALPDGEAPAYVTQLATDLRTLMVNAQAEGPEEVQGHLATLGGAFDAMAASGNIADLDPTEVRDAQSALNEFNSNSCGWPLIRVAAAPRAQFVGVPQQLGPGFHSFEIRNDTSGTIIVDLFQVIADDGVKISDRFPTREAGGPEGVVFQGRVVLAPGQAGPINVELELGEWAFVAVDPSTPGVGPRLFVDKTVTPFVVVEGG